MLLSVFLLSAAAHSKIHEYETTHLKSMAGTGVGGVLAEEAAFLNPASLAFFNTATVYAQKDTGKLTEDSVSQPKPKSMGFVMADGNPSLSGSLSYITQEEDIYKRKRWGLSLSSPLSEKSAFGVSYRHSTDEDTQRRTTKKYYQSVFGVTHSLDDKTTLGIVAYDPFKSQGHETKALLGIQYVLMTYISAAFDLGADYNSDEISTTMLYRGALQVKVLNDFFLRFGGFNDKLRAEKGNGYGIAWVQPRLSFEVSQKNTKSSRDVSLGRSDTKLKETSFAVSMRF